MHRLSALNSLFVQINIYLLGLTKLRHQHAWKGAFNQFGVHSISRILSLASCIHTMSPYLSRYYVKMEVTLCER